MTNLYEFEHAYQLKSLVEMLIDDKATFSVAATLNRIMGIMGQSERTREYITYCLAQGYCKLVK